MNDRLLSDLSRGIDLVLGATRVCRDCGMTVPADPLKHWHEPAPVDSEHATMLREARDYARDERGARERRYGPPQIARSCDAARTDAVSEGAVARSPPSLASPLAGRMIRALLVFAAGMGIGFSVGIAAMASAKQPPIVVPATHTAQPAPLINCDRRGLDELYRVCRARDRIEKVR